jgi:UDP-N-acetyl-D-mannosaminuronic acid dehydrogenase
LITERLAHESLGEIIAVEPNIDVQTASLAKLGVPLESLIVGLEKADVVVLLVDHSPFKEITLTQLGNATLIDTRGIL